MGAKNKIFAGLFFFLLCTFGGFTHQAQTMQVTHFGKASWYGMKFHGKKTASGEVFNMYGLTAAHKELPFNTHIKVTNLLNNEEIMVRINDRGPYHPGRSLDLSYGAAEKLKMLTRGVAPVRMVIVSPDGEGIPGA